MQTNSALQKNESLAKCEHCHNPIPASLGRIADEVGHEFCCTGCRAIYSAIQACDLGAYYKIRDSQRPELSPAAALNERFDYLDTPEIRNEFESAQAPGRMYFFVSGIQCAACVWILEKIPELSSDVLHVRIDGVKKVAEVQIKEGGRFAAFADFAQRFGYSVRPIKLAEKLEYLQDAARREELRKIAITAVGAGNLMLLSVSVYLGADANLAKFFNWVSLALMIPILWIGGRSLFLNSYASIKTRVPSLDLPLAVALGAGFILSCYHLFTGGEKVYFDTLSILILLILSSRYFVNRLQERFIARQGQGAGLFPDYANVSLADGTKMVPLRALMVGDRIIVKTGEKIPADGKVISGSGWINEAILTGESLPRLAVAGAEVFGGTTLVDGEEIIEVMTTPMESRMGILQRESAERALLKSDVTKRLEVWAQGFTIVVLAVAVGAFLFFAFRDMSTALDRSLSLLIVACPCAIAFGAPLVFSQALARAVGHGVFLRSADVFERLHGLKSVVFDKTGTLTSGQFTLVPRSSLLDAETMTAIVAIESLSPHPIAQAIVKIFGASLGALPSVHDFEVLPSKGVRGVVAGHLYEVRTSQARHEGAEGLVIWVDINKNGRNVGALGFKDAIREEAQSIVESFKKKGMAINILSGDRRENVHAVGNALALEPTRLFSEISPEDKERILSTLPHPVMIGDGVNDAAAMSRADLGIAVGGAMERALKVADVFLTQDGLKKMLGLWGLAAETESALMRVRIFSIGYNVLAGSLALSGIVSPLLAAILMPVSSISVLAISFWSMRGDRWTS